jgi:hypothetical protein
MMKGSPNRGPSPHPAEYILTAPKEKISEENISCDTFRGYFTKNKEKIYLSLRRQWIGQASDSEHRRAEGLARKPGNAPWVFESIEGTPSSGWRDSKQFPSGKRRTVYMIFLTIKP